MEYLFIGGSHDGQRIEVDERYGEVQMSAMTEDPPRLITSEAIDPKATFEVERYIRRAFAYKYGSGYTATTYFEVSCFVIASMPHIDAFKQVFLTYGKTDNNVTRCKNG